MMPFLDDKDFMIDFSMPIDSIAISGHKYLGCPMPCGVMITRKSLMEVMQKPVEYLNSVDTTITGSRNGLASLFIWNVIKSKSRDDFKKEVQTVFEISKYLEKGLKDMGISTFRNELSSTVIFLKPEKSIVEKWQLACTGDIAHVVVMPSVTKEKIENFISDMKNCHIDRSKCLKAYMEKNCFCDTCLRHN